MNKPGGRYGALIVVGLMALFITAVFVNMDTYTYGTNASRGFFETYGEYGCFAVFIMIPILSRALRRARGYDD